MFLLPIFYSWKLLKINFYVKQTKQIFLDDSFTKNGQKEYNHFVKTSLPQIFFKPNMPLAECLIFIDNTKKIIQTIPDNFNDGTILNSLLNFVYPFDVTDKINQNYNKNRTQEFTYVQTLENRDRIYGFVRLKPDNSAVVLVSKGFLEWKEILLQVLRLAEIGFGFSNNVGGEQNQEEIEPEPEQETITSNLDDESSSSSSSSDSDSEETPTPLARQSLINNHNPNQNQNSKQITLISPTDLEVLNNNNSKIAAKIKLQQQEYSTKKLNLTKQEKKSLKNQQIILVDFCKSFM